MGVGGSPEATEKAITEPGSSHVTTHLRLMGREVEMPCSETHLEDSALMREHTDFSCI